MAEDKKEARTGDENNAQKAVDKARIKEAFKECLSEGAADMMTCVGKKTSQNTGQNR